MAYEHSSNVSSDSDLSLAKPFRVTGMFIVADIGGTKMRVAGSRDLERFDEPLILDTPSDYDEALAKIAEAAAQCAGGTRGERVIVGKSLPLWKNRPFAHDLESKIGRPVLMENDAALVGLGEAVYGAGKGSAIIVYITVSTGVNGARIIDGTIDRSRRGFEIGGQYLSIGDRPQTLEDLVSGRAIEKKFRVNSPKDLGKEHAVWEKLARILAFGVHNTILHWSPDRVVIGGSMMNEIGIPIPSVEAHVRNIMQKFPDIPEIMHSSLGALGGLWGGLARLKQLG